MARRKHGPRSPLDKASTLARGLIIGGVLFLTETPARAGVEPIDADDAQGVENEVEGDLTKIRRDLDAVNKVFGTGLKGQVSRVERRLREGELHFLLNDFLRASIVLLDVVEDPESKKHPRYDDCVYLLGEALRKSRNYAGAKQYYEQILPRVRGDRLKDVVVGLLEVASATNNYDQVEAYVSRLRAAGSMSRPDVDYIYGKMLFKSAGADPTRVQRAYEAFRAIPPGTGVSAQAAYYAGVAMVRMTRYEEAIAMFKDALERAGSTKEGDQLKQLAYLSIGRLYQETGEVANAAAAYQQIPQSSPYFGDMLYEIAWAHVRAANMEKDEKEKNAGFVRGLRATELLLATAPTSRLYPQARILEGNLQIRLGASETAYDTFQAIVDRYGGARDKLDELLQANSEPRQFFDQLVNVDLNSVGSTAILPPVAVSWALEEEQLGRAMVMNQELTESQKFLAESQELVRTLNEALETEQRFQLIPGMAKVRSKSLSTENRLLNLTRRLLNLERRLVWKYTTTEERAALDSVHADAGRLEADIQKLPQTIAEVEKNKAESREDFHKAGLRTFKESYRVSRLRAQVVAVEVWMGQNRDVLSAEEKKQLEQRLAQTREELNGLEGEIEKLASDLRTAESSAGSDGGRARARQLREEYALVIDQEIRLLKTHRAKLPKDFGNVTQRLDQARVTIAQLDAELERMQSDLDRQIEQRVDEIKTAIAAEAQQLKKYEGEHGELMSGTKDLLGPVAARALTDVGRQFNQLVLQADVGIIDVAWMRKQSETRKVNDLVKEQQDRTLELEKEFADVLED